MSSNYLHGLRDKTLPGETKHSCPLTSNRELMMDQSMDATKVQLRELVRFNWVTYGNMGEGLFTGEGVSQRQLHHQSPPHPGCQRTSKTGNLGQLHSLQPAQQVGARSVQMPQLV